VVGGVDTLSQLSLIVTLVNEQNAGRECTVLPCALREDKARYCHGPFPLSFPPCWPCAFRHLIDLDSEAFPLPLCPPTQYLPGVAMAFRFSALVLCGLAHVTIGAEDHGKLRKLPLAPTKVGTWCVFI
jgi:hypothetical protein